MEFEEQKYLNMRNRLFGVIFFFLMCRLMRKAANHI